nr:RNA-binding protein [Rhizobium sp. Q54]
MSAFAFANPAILLGLLALPVIWWLLRLTPPRPKTEVFPPLRILASVLKREETPAKSPWWLTLLRMLLAAALILAIADPVLNPRTGSLSADGPLVLVVDNGWATSTDWDRRIETAEALIADAEGADLPVSITFTADPTHDAVPASAAAAREKLAAARPRPLVPERERAANAIGEALNGTAPGTLVILSDGLSAAGDEAALATLGGLAPADIRLIAGDGVSAVALTSAANSAETMSVTATWLPDAAARSVSVSALDIQGRPLASGTLQFAAGVATATAEIEAPFELRNDFARLGIDGLATAGAAHLLDDGFKRRRVALLAGESGSDFQPLLQPLYYISRALQPYADLIEPTTADLSVSIPQVLERNPSAIIMADVGRLPAGAYEPLQQWISRGGTLIRFAGPRLAAAPSDDPLVPVILRQGERTLGGALSWSEPQPLADFPDFGPFAGMPRAADVTINRQVLAQPTPDLAERTWASLADGTPLVTTREQEAGRIVLFHTSAEATWSNMPLSGNFVEMLRRLVQMARAGGATTTSDGSEAASSALPPYRLLGADGILTTETGTAKPISITPGRTPSASFDHPPGLYGTEDGFSAVNLLAPGTELSAFQADLIGQSVVREALAGEEATSLRPHLFALAFLLILLDSLVVLFMNGAFSRLPRVKPAAAAITALTLLLAFHPNPAGAQDAKPGDELLMQRLDTTHLAYVVTGEAEVDRLSEQGLAGLSEFLTYRTTLEPGAPVGLDIATDELSFYPMIYWPISASAPMPSAAAISRIDAYMRNGGTVLFDTRDQISSLDGSGTTSANGERLQAILANIDIPPLEPTPEDHVLSRSFYLLNDFPGRYAGSPLWVEARQEAAETNSELSSSGDGVTPLLITGNDFAGAWAVDNQGNALLPTVPADEMQREYAYRAGVNIMMYMLTGNYKSDQVHVPDLLERLGQ